MIREACYIACLGKIRNTYKISENLKSTDHLRDLGMDKEYNINTDYAVKFQVLMVASMKMAVFRAIALMTEAVSMSETSVNIYQTTQCNKPENSHLHGMC
jgi:hypothetical protein